MLKTNLPHKRGWGKTWASLGMYSLVLGSLASWLLCYVDCELRVFQIDGEAKSVAPPGEKLSNFVEKSDPGLRGRV